MIISGANFAIPSGHGRTALLVNPPVYDMQYWAEWSQPAGLLRIGALLKTKGYKVHLIDCMEPNERRKVPYRRRGKQPRRVGNVSLWENHYGITFEELDRRLTQLPDPPGIILVTSIMTYWWQSTRDVVSLLRSRYPSTQIVVGGIYPTLCSAHAEENLGADVAIVTGEVPAASDLPPDVTLYAKTPLYSIVTTSRGCPYNCAYCAQRAINGEGVRQRPPEDVVEEIAQKVEHGIREFAFYEDSLLFNEKNHLRRILQLLLERGLKTHLYAPEGMDPRLLNPDLVHEMRAAGWQKIHLGFESVYSGVRESWARSNHVTNEAFESAIEMCQSAGFKLRSPEINAFVLYGVPDEKLEDVVDTVLYVSHKVGSIIPMLFTPVPGSLLYERMAEYFSASALDLEDLNGKLIPFAQRNGYQASDYMDLQRLMFVLNHAVHGRSMDLLDDSLASRSIRDRLPLLYRSTERLSAGLRFS